MAQYKLTKEDYNNLEKILNIETKLINIYSVLEILEINKQKDSEAYKEALVRLKILLDLEEMVYSKLCGDPRRITEILFYISGYNQINSNLYLKISDFTSEDFIKARINLRLEYLLSITEFPQSEDEQIMDISYPERDEEVDCEFLNALPNPEEIERQYFYGEKLNYETERDILNTILIILNEYLLNPEYQNIYHLLIKFKYQLSFLFIQIEKIFLTNNFEINKTLYWGANMVIDENNSNLDDLELSKESYAEDLLYEQGENVKELLNADINDLRVYGNAIICQIVIRACVLFIKDKTRKDYIDYIMQEIYDNQVVSETMNEIIRKTFNNFDSDKFLPNILRLKLD